MYTIAYLALCLFVFAVPWEGVFQLVPGIAIISRVAGGVAVLLVLGSVLLGGRWRRWHGFHVAAVLFVLWAGMGLLIVNVSEVPPKFWTYLQLVLMLLITWEAARTESRVRGLMLAYVLGCYVSAIGTVMVYRSQAGALRRFSAGGVDANDLANTLALALPMAWYLALRYRKPLWVWVCRAYLPLGLVAIGLNGSRGGMLSTLVAMMIVPLTMTHLTPARLAAAVVTLGTAGALAIAYVPSTIYERFATTTSEVEAGDLHGRVEIWMAGVRAFSQRPLVGYGAGGFKGAAAQWGFRRVAHNSYLAVLVEQGIIGFALYALMVLAVVREAFRLPRLERRFALVLLATMAIAMLPLSWEDRKAIWISLALLLGLARASAPRGRLGPGLAEVSGPSHEVAGQPAGVRGRVGPLVSAPAVDRAR